MGSYNCGKAWIDAWIKDNFPKGSTCLDVGACDGKWAKHLGDYLKMDACEAFLPNIEKHELAKKYNKVYWGDIANLEYEYYDLIIFGDVIEHLYIGKAQKVLDYAKDRCKDLIIAVPYEYPQDEIYGNPYEKHIQDDLTPEIFDMRYPGYELLLRPAEDYAYYHKQVIANMA